MRTREIIRERRKAAVIDMDIDEPTIQRYIDAYQCPFCKDGATYKVLPLHFYYIHGISAYEFRELYDWNRGHQLSSDETVELQSQIHKRIKTVKYLDNYRAKYGGKASIQTRYLDSGQRHEAIVGKIKLANTLVAKERFALSMSKVDRKVIAQRIPKEVRVRVGKEGQKGLQLKYGKEQLKVWMSNARKCWTPESIQRRVQHAQITMRKYYDNPEWCKKLGLSVSKARLQNSKVPTKDRPAIIERYKNGESQGKIAKEYGVSRSLISLITLGKCR